MWVTERIFRVHIVLFKNLKKLAYIRVKFTTKHLSKRRFSIAKSAKMSFKTIFFTKY
jgi:hypothetical protein